MDPPPAPQPTTTAPIQLTTFPDAQDSPRTSDLDPQPTTKLRLMCSYGGHIIPRPHDKSLCYVGGDTRMVVIPRASTLPDLLTRLSKTLLNHHTSQHPFTLKYQLPNEDLDSLITVSTDEDLDNMIDEYDRLSGSKSKQGRIRLFLFPSPSLDSTQSMGPIIDGSNRSEDWFLNALNSAAELQRGFSEPGSITNLLGLDHEVEVLNPNIVNNKSVNDLQSVPDSPIIETTSSFGSTSSQPSFLNLAPIRVHVDDGSGRFVDQRTGIEEHFAQMAMAGGGGGGIQLNKQVDEGFIAISSSPNVAMMAAVGGGGGEFANRNYPDDDRSDHGYRKQQQVTGQQQQQQQMMGQKQQIGGELPSPDSVSSDNSLSNAIARQNPAMYQDSNGQAGNNRHSQGMQVQVSDSGYVYHPQYEQHQQHMLQQHQHQQQQQQQHHQQQQLHLLQQQQHQQQQQGQTHQQAHQQVQNQAQQQQAQNQAQQQAQNQAQQQAQNQAQQQAQNQSQQQAQQQYLPPGAHYVQHHHQGSVAMPGYYPMYQPQQQNHHQQQQYPVYYVPAGQAQGYSLPGQQHRQQQANMGEAPTSATSNRTQTQPNPAYNQTRNMNVNMNMPPPKSEVGSGLYRTNTAAGGPQLVQVVSNQQQPLPKSQPQQQQQYVGYSQPHHPSQSVSPNSGATTGGYAYEFADPPRSQIYYTQPLQPALSSQYQGVTSGGPTMMMPDGSSQPSNEKGN